MTTRAEKREQRTVHSRRRRRMLAWSAPVVVLVVLLGGYVTALWGLNAWGVQRYDEEPAAAAGLFEGVARASGPVEPWQPYFNAGTAQVADARAFSGSEELREALRLVPEAGPAQGASPGQKDPQAPECRVRRNLSLALETLGDETVGSDEVGAAVYWAEAQELIEPCTSEPDNAESSARQQQKQDDVTDDDEPPDDPDEPDEPEEPEEPEEPDDPEPTPTPTPTEEPSTDPQRDELEERNREAQRERQQQQEREGGGYGGGQNW